MSFLKKLGLVMATITGVVFPAFAPIAALFPNLFGSGSKGATALATVSNDLTAIGQVIVLIETAFANVTGETGAQKLIAATNLVGPIILTSQLVSGKKIADPVMMQKGIGEITQGMVDVLNALHQDNVPH